MLRSMYSAISGMQAFQTMLDVIGNNIANVDTPGFKSSSVDFADVMSQITSGGSSPTTTTGGTNPQQVGLGVGIGATQMNFTQGSQETTGNPTDLFINGQGLFVVKNGTDTYYTRAGDFTLDSNDNLVLPDGSIAQGYYMTNAAPSGGGTPTSTLDTTTQPKAMNLNDMLAAYVTSLNGTSDGNGGTYTVNADGTVTDTPAAGSSATPVTLSFALPASPDIQIGPDGSLTATVEVTSTSGTGASATSTTSTQQINLGSLALATFSNPSGLENVGSNLFTVSNNSGAASYGVPGVNNAGSIQAGYLEMSNVDLTQEMTNMIVAQNAFAANSHMIGTDNTILNDIVNMKNS
ncbi:flagellar hook-basal body complex protein [Alicyclobacillus cycloheptanicus]|uniref:Flagellar hook protein FlgE n=1 Tax=Alicyclobacillus cycloheptanicus TaxID=1457 RepID=A0ABT9XJR3_9BACL|nr:flagellar hook-basal body complex protein [Alicyclobacillus cycloheptanicus]MDQ0190552.1 flagellar hook protein FlgE [Alicyclobacillus cycloheptanicus]WDM01394.1 flagellar hook-basal body complex protein [Alicyclobacillus cycloheptanicus]